MLWHQLRHYGTEVGHNQTQREEDIKCPASSPASQDSQLNLFNLFYTNPPKPSFRRNYS